MSNTIKIRRGSGVPTASDFAAYELAYDYTGNDLYVKVGSNMVKVNSEGSGTVTNVVAGNGLTGGGTTTATLDLDFSELTDMTGDISGTTEFILQNGTTESRKAASEIKLTAFDATGFSIAGTVDTSGTPVASEYARFTDANTIEGRSAAGVRTDLGLVIGTNVQAQNDYLQDIADLSTDNSAQDGYVLAYNDAYPRFELVEQSGGVSFNGSTAHGLLTYGNSTTADVEDNLTFDGSLLTNTGDIKIASGSLGVNTNANGNNGRIAATSHIEAGVGSGAIGLTINDGGGNSNVTFNHTGRVPEQNGNSGRIEVNTDGVGNQYMAFELAGNVTAGVVVSTNEKFRIDSAGADVTGQLVVTGQLRSSGTDGFTIGNYGGYDRIVNNSNQFRFLTDGDAYANMQFATVTAGTWQGSAIDATYVGSLPASKITSGTFADARIAASSITQHTDSKYLRSDTGDTAAGNITFTGKLLGNTNTTSILNGASVTNVNNGFSDDISTGKASGLQPFRYSNNTTNTPLGGGGSMANNANWGLSLYSHGTGGSGNYGLQMSGGDNDNQLFFIRRVTNGSFGSWFEMWHSGNDGSGSGLDADTLDGSHASAFLTSVPNHSANLLTSGTVPLARISGLTTSNIASDAAIQATQLGSLPASKITSGTFNIARIPTTAIRSNYRLSTDASNDTNNASTSGIYRIDSGQSNVPGSITYGTLVTFNNLSDTGFQIVADYHAGGGSLYWRGGNSSTFSGAGSNTSWFKIWNEDNDGPNSGLNADLLDGYHLSTTRNSANTVPVRDGNGYLNLGWINTTSGNTTTASSDYYVNTNDGYIRKKTLANVRTEIMGVSSGASFLRSDANDTASGQYTFTKVNDHAIRVGTIRGTTVGSQSGEYIHMYNKVHIGSPSGWGSRSAPTYGLSTYGGADLATDTGDVTIGGNLKLTRAKGLLWDYAPNTSLGGYIAHPGGGMYRTNTGTHTGALTITIPTGGAPADMISFWVDVFDYVSYESQSFYIAGYVYQTAGSNEWVNETALMLTPKENHARTVRFGHNGTNHVVYIGELTDTWAYPQVTVRNVQIGFGSDVDTYNDNWDISFEASAFQNVDATYSDADTLPTAGKIKMKNGSGKFVHNATSSRDKIRVWNSGSYAIGMQLGNNYGGLANQYAMTFNMNDQSSRGFLWCDDGHGLSAGAMALTTDGKLTVAHSMRVGYGESDTTTPGASYRLDVSGNGYISGDLWVSQKVHTWSSPTGHVASMENNGTYLMLRNPEGNTGIYIGDSGDSNNYYQSGSHRFRSYDGSTYQGTFNNTGLKIGTGFASYKLDVAGDARILSGSLGVGVTPNATDGRGDFSNDVVAYSTSDKRLKENIKPLDSALDKVLQISGVEFDWKELTEEEKKTIHGNQGHDVGVIAQEIEEVLPEVVTTRDSGYKAVKYEKIVPLLIEAIKEQQQQINKLEEKLNG